jgi:hypothetical protein
MLFQRINRTDPEKVFIVMKAGEALLQGRPVAIQSTGADEGITGMLADAATDGSAVLGIAHTAIASGEFGLVQVYGYRTDGVVLISASNLTILNNAVYCVASASSGFLSMSVSAGAATAVQPNFVGQATVSLASSTGLQTSAVFIRCM